MTLIPHVQWVKSSYSNQDGGNCVEWSPSAVATYGVVAVRDSKVPHGPVLVLAPAAWAAFVDFAAERHG
ncbi:DUF397 domain-containing protein [Streptomyces sp. NPDC050617]|uniref:DUF397 domain-containing protein n=1 Tax=Streptomyces sp. NPDC050617 TaxID=3154628 RepID=UPI00343C30C4